MHQVAEKAVAVTGFIHHIAWERTLLRVLYLPTSYYFNAVCVGSVTAGELVIIGNVSN